MVHGTPNIPPKVPRRVSSAEPSGEATPCSDGPLWPGRLIVLASLASVIAYVVASEGIHNFLRYLLATVERVVLLLPGVR